MLLGAEFLTPFAMLDQLLGIFQSSRLEETMVESFGDKGSGGCVMAALALMDVFEDCLTLLRLNAALVDTGDIVPHQLSVDYVVCCCPTLHLLGRDLISRQLFVYQEIEDGLGP